MMFKSWTLELLAQIPAVFSKTEGVSLMRCVNALALSLEQAVSLKSSVKETAQATASVALRLEPVTASQDMETQRAQS